MEIVAEPSGVLYPKIEDSGQWKGRKVEKLKEANLKITIYNLKFAISRSDMQSPACQKPLAV